MSLAQAADGSFVIWCSAPTAGPSPRCAATPPWDRGVRFHASVPPAGTARHGALDHAGARLAVAGPSKLWVTNIEDGASVLGATEHGAGDIPVLPQTVRSRGSKNEATPTTRDFAR